MDQRRLSDGFCLNTLYILLWNLWKWTGRIGSIACRQKLFPRWPTLRHLFCYHIYQHDDTQKGHLDCCLSLCNSPLLLQSGLDSDISTGTQNTDASPSSTSLGNIPGKLLCYTLRGIREKVKSNKGPLGKELNHTGMTLSLPLVHLHPALVVEPEGTSKAPVLVRERLSPTREGKFQWKVCLHLHLEQGRMPLVERSDGCGCCFFLSYR